ncbi:MAG TPA: LD-carboxypeptidase [Flavisolibacter sp.]|jgi:muramoyltetrapeptide carboxypeptidase|nr:LD-carboxypeptidase [Flavisolibacter sp.]
MSIHIPPYLEKGDAVGIVAPAGYMPVEKMQTCIETLDAWGYTVVMGATTHSQSENYFSGTDEERLADFQEMLDNKDIKAIICARGGYGMSRIIDRLNFKKFRKHPKWLVGYSDITVLHAHILTRFKIASLHAPMASAYNDGGAESAYIQSVRKALAGEPADYECAPHPMNRTGEAKGELVGGNLSLLVHLIGTPSDLAVKHKILFIEDVGEYLYTIDRMILQLKRAGKLDKLEGLIIGGFTDIKDTDRPFGKSVYELIREHVKEFDYPVCYQFPVSHERENYALKIGGHYKLDVTDEKVKLYES